MPPPTSNARANRASFSSTHQSTHPLRRKHASSTQHYPLSLVGVPWRFLHLTADSGAGLPPVLSDAGRQYMAEDAYRWRAQQSQGADVVAAIPQLDSADTRPLRLSVYGDGDHAVAAGRAGAEAKEEEEEEEDEDEPKDIPPLPEFNPFSDTFAVALSPKSTPNHSSASADTTASPPTNPTCATPTAAAGGEEVEAARRKRGMTAAGLLSHFAQKEVVDEERERTRKRERSKWENTASGAGASGGDAGGVSGGQDGGGVMVGGLGLADESDGARAVRLAVSAEEEERRRRLSAAAEDDALALADMPDMSDFIKLYEDEDEPSYPAIIWRQKERLTEADDVPPSVVAELQNIERERAAGLSRRRGPSRGSGGSRGEARPAHERKLTLRFNLGLGKDYEEEREDGVSGGAAAASRQKAQLTNNRFPPLAAARKQAVATKPPQSAYGRQWYLPVKQWATAEEEKERLEAATAERREQHADEKEGDGAAGEEEVAAADGYHGEGWRLKVLALKAELPALYCSRAFKAFLLRERQRRRLPHYLEGVEALDERREEEEERRAIQAAVLAITTPRVTHSSLSSTRTAQPAASASVEPASARGSVSSAAAAAGEEEREGDLQEYMREVRMRELSLAGLRWIKERERAMEERERRRRDREKRKARAGSALSVTGAAAAGGAGGEAGGGGVEDEDEVDLDKLFDVPDYPTGL